MTRIDLNADVGESFGRWTLGNDAELIPHVSSANVACGFHAGDPGGIRRTIRLARAAGAAVGAHPGFPDLAGFGRRAISIEPGDLEDLIVYQLGAVAGLAAAEGVQLSHLKPHGALYAMAAGSEAVAAALVAAVQAFDSRLAVYTMPGGQLARVAGAAGLRVIREGFADRAYAPDGSLAPRSEPGAVIVDEDQVAHRAVRLVRDHMVEATDGREISLEIESLCIHGDTPGAPALARRLRRSLLEAGVLVESPSR